MEPIYLDHAATTPVDDRVTEAMIPVYKNTFGNPSSIHVFGRKSRQLMDEARRTMAKSIHADEKEIIFTSGGTEADNLAIIGTAFANRDKGNHIITTQQEHHAALHAADYLEKKGFDVTYLPVYEDGKIKVSELQNALTEETILVSTMFVNNETGVIQPIEEIGKVLSDHQAFFHTDAVQAYGLLDMDVKEMGIDLLTVSSHKINGPKGVAFLYAEAHVPLDTLQFGGEQERKRRPGTENVVSVAGFQKAVELAMENKTQRKQLYEQYRDLFLKILNQNGISYEVNGELDNSLPSIVNISFPGTNVETMLTNLDLDGIAASSGSACTAGSVEPSHVLLAMYGENSPCSTNSIRFSFGSFNTMENVEEAAQRVAKIVNRITV